ncbi:MAG TPA: reverse transcriptase domain-containing protein [Terriglobales bacterium]|nr:reverse transcriptase domain-containing protein [Terriglobales bacterium]
MCLSLLFSFYPRHVWVQRRRSPSLPPPIFNSRFRIAEGYRWVVDLDLEKFFDRVNHDRLLAAVAKRVADKRMLKLIRAFLEAGVMEDGLVSPVDEGTPQGGPLTPLTQKVISNLRE